jgi:hypothetical protein
MVLTALGLDTDTSVGAILTTGPYFLCNSMSSICLAFPLVYHTSHSLVMLAKKGPGRSLSGLDSRAYTQ